MIRHAFKTLFLFAFLAITPLNDAFAQQLGVKDIKVGEGAEAFNFSKVKVHYTGWLMDGKKFDSSKDRGQPFEFMVMARQVIPGWDLGVSGMKVGGVRELIVPPQLGYGKRGVGPIPPNATLKFEIELLEVDGPAFGNVDNDQLKALMAKGVKVIDIRRPEEWKKTGIIEGSIPLTAFDRRMQLVSGFSEKLEATVKRDEPLIFICRTGNRSSMLANALSQQAGYKKIQNHTLGITHWIGEKLPVVAYKGS